MEVESAKFIMENELNRLNQELADRKRLGDVTTLEEEQARGAISRKASYAVKAVDAITEYLRFARGYC